MDTVPLVLFTLIKESYAIPASHVREIVRSQEITPMPQTHSFIEGVLNLRGHMIAVIDLKKRLEFETSDKATAIIVVRIPNALVGLMVDRVEDVIHVTQESVQEVPMHATSKINQDFFLGLLQTQNRSVPILNIAKIFSTQEEQELVGIRETIPN